MTRKSLLKSSIWNSRKKFNVINVNGMMDFNLLGKFIKSVFVILLCLSVVCVSCKKNDDDPKPPEEQLGGGTEKGKYLGVIGFAGYTKTENIGLLNDYTKTKYKSFIDGLPMGDATWLYYSVDQAIETLKKAQLPEELVNVYIVTFTDGLDDGSATAFGDRSIPPSEYLQRTNTKLKATTFGANKIPITAYSIGYKRSGTFTSSEEQTFDNNLKQLASDDNNAYPVTEMSVVNQKFQDIANSLYKLNTSQNLEVKINFRQVGTKFRFTFDNVATTDAGALNSTLYIEATLGLDGQTATFENIQYSPGLSASGDSKLIGVKSNEKDVFVFKNLKKDSGDLLSTDNIKEFYKDPGITEWKWNDEFKNAGDTDIKPEIKSVIVMLVLDCSTSLNSGGENGSEKVRTAAKNFIDVLVGDNSGGGGGGETDGDAPTISFGSTSPVNITLPYSVNLSVTVHADNKIQTTTIKRYDDGTLNQAKSTTLTNQIAGDNGKTDFSFQISDVIDNSKSTLSEVKYSVSIADKKGNITEKFFSYLCGSENPTLSPPTGVTATQNGSNISISWNNVSGATNYKVYRSSSISGTYSQIGSATTSISLSDNSPLSGANYYKVKSVNSDGESDFSNYANCNYLTGTWTQKANFAGGERAGAVGFSIDAKGYIGMGYSSGYNYKQDFWEYNPITNTWTQKANFPKNTVFGGTGFSIGNVGYVQMIDGNSFKSFFYEYNPTSNIWIQKTDISGTYRSGQIGFSISNKGYIGTGYNSEDSPSYKKDFWEYNASSNTWTQKANLTGGGRAGAVGFSIGNKGYIGTANYDSKNGKDFWEYDLSSNTWTQKADFAGEVRQYAVGFSIGNNGYVGIGYTGTSNATNPGNSTDFWEYNPTTNTWIQKTSFPGTLRSGAVGFSIGNKGYVGIGCNGNQYHQDFYEFVP